VTSSLGVHQLGVRVKWSSLKSARGAKIRSNSPGIDDQLVRKRPAVRVRPWAPILAPRDTGPSPRP
jgi:hypothetical protein